MISILTPTKGRLPRLQEMMQSAMETAGATVEFVIYVDDDIRTGTALNFQLKKVEESGHHLQILSGHRRLLGKYWNDCAKAAKGNILQLANDDILFRTKGWAIKVEEEMEKFKDGLGVVHCDNGQANARVFSTHPFVTKKWVEILGYFVPPCFAGDYTDTWIWEVATGVGRTRYVQDVLIEHMHWSFGKSRMDSTYEARMKSEDGMARLYTSLRSLRETAVLKLTERLQK